ncbi:MAG: DNA-methyltransferase [Phycisphaerae bacterium]
MLGLHLGDNLPLMADMPDGSCDLIYIDPPFFTRRKRTAVRSDAAYDDSWRGGRDEYLDFIRRRLQQCQRLLPRHGTLYVHLDFRVAHHVRILLDDLFGERNFLNEIIWHYRTGGLSKQWFGRKHDTILVYAKSLGDHRFNLQREGAYRTDGLNHDAAGRPYKNTKNGRLYFNPEGPALSDVWDIPFLSTVSRERTDWPTQKPLALLERIIRASSDPGDTVADFFCGSGTTLIAARRLARESLGCDIAPQAIAITRERLDGTTHPLVLPI